MDIQRTHPAPIEVVSDSVLGLVGVGSHSRVEVLNLGALTRCSLFGATLIDMDVSPYGRTDKVAHHGSPIVVRGESTTSQFETSLVSTINSPTGLCHRTMASLVFLLCMTSRQKEPCKHSIYVHEIGLTEWQSAEIAAILATTQPQLLSSIAKRGAR